jgi:hypothetical protein
MKKKLYYSEILAVYSLEKKGLQERLQCTPLGPGKVKPGYFRAIEHGVELPKRKRGQKFIVRYTSVHEKEL